MNIFELPESDFSEDLWEKLKFGTKPIVVYGMGNGGDKLVARLAEIGREPADFFASDGFVRGQSFHGKRVLSFAEVKKKYDDFLILVSFGSNRPDVISAVYSLGEQYELYIPDMPLAGEEYFTAQFYREHYEDCLSVYRALADDASRDLFAAILWYKLTGEPACLRAAVQTGDEQVLLSYNSMKSAVDVGAYRGDTLKEMLMHAPNLSHVIAVEPDEKNYARLCAYAETVSDCQIKCVHAAAYDTAGVLSFASSGNRNATIGDKISATASFEHREKTVKSVKIDDLIQSRRVDYIKYDTEGAERSALEGSRETITESIPYLRVSVYHRSEDIFSLPLWLMRLAGEKYHYYLRRCDCIPAWECDLIAVPKSNNEKG